MRRSVPNRQRGFALMTVMAVSTVAMIAATSLVGDGAVGERRAQDELLLKLRAYWAAQGHVSYAKSRSAAGPPCGAECADLDARAQYLDDILGELASSGSEREWAYPEAAASYRFPVQATAANADPLISVELSFPAAATAHPLIAAAWPVRGDFLTFLCVGVADAGETCAAGTIQTDSGVAYIAHMEPK